MTGEPRLETADERAARLLGIGLDVACRLRDGDDPATVRAELWRLHDSELADLAVLLAAGLDVGRPVSELHAWYRGEPLPVEVPRVLLKPCGTVAAHRRHLYRGERPCEPCRDAYRIHDRDRKRARKIRKAA